MSDKKQLCDKCASEPITLDEFTSHHKYMKLKRQVEDLKLYVKYAIETNDILKEEFPDMHSPLAFISAYKNIQEKLNEI